MDLQKYYVVFLRKGPSWTGEETPELMALQEAHLAHQTILHETGTMAVSGPVVTESEIDLRGISIFFGDAFESLDELRELVEEDPMFKVDRLVGEYITWYTKPVALGNYQK